jgi:hypothetical protein
MKPGMTSLSDMKPKLTHGLLQLIRTRTGKSRYIINKMLAGDKVDPELAEAVLKILNEEEDRKQQLKQKIESL